MATKFIVTTAGLAALADAVEQGTTVTLSEIRLADGRYTPSAGQTAMQGNLLATLTDIAVGNVGDNIIHLEKTDTSSASYRAYELGVFTSGGILFGIASNASETIIEKTSAANAVLAIDFALSSDVSQAITVSGVTYHLPPATTETQGIVELATSTETIQGNDTSRAVTPAGLASRTATESRQGLVELATNAETQAGTDTSRAVTPAGLASRTATESRQGLVELATNAETQAGTDTTRAVTPAGLAEVLLRYLLLTGGTLTGRLKIRPQTALALGTGQARCIIQHVNSDAFYLLFSDDGGETYTADRPLTISKTTGQLLSNGVRSSQFSFPDIGDASQITTPNTGTVIKAPGDGWIQLIANGGGVGSYGYLSHAGRGIRVRDSATTTSGNGNYIDIYLPVSNGESITVSYSTPKANTFLWFNPAKSYV
ncbi:MAG: phage tail protein [Oxalobacter sp.]|nr:phage tail protein [Oxalobacter sp.]